MLLTAAEYKDVSRAERCDAEHFANAYNSFLEEVFSKWTSWTSLSDAAQKLTSGHTPLYHDVDVGDSLFITVECVEPLAINFAKAKRVYAAQINSEPEACKT